MKQIIIEMHKMILRFQEKGQKTAEGRCSIYERKMQLYFFLNQITKSVAHRSLVTGYEHCRGLRKIRRLDGSSGQIPFPRCISQSLCLSCSKGTKDNLLCSMLPNRLENKPVFFTFIQNHPEG